MHHLCCIVAQQSSLYKSLHLDQPLIKMRFAAHLWILDIMLHTPQSAIYIFFMRKKFLEKRIKR